MRLFPTLAWVGVATFVGVAIAAKHTSWRVLDYGAVLLLLNGGIVCHGLLAHSANDYMDWITGTDVHSPGLFSGGSRVIPDGDLTLSSVRNAISIAALHGIVLMFLLYLRIGRAALLGGTIGALTAAFYSLPPLMLVYQPLVGEWLAVLPGLVACSWLACVAASPNVTLQLNEWLFILATGLSLVGHLMFHHLSDIEADLAATPRKLTTPAYLAGVLGYNPRTVPSSYWLLTAVLCGLTKSYFLGLGVLAAGFGTLFVKLSDRRRLAWLDKALLVFISFAIIIQALS